MINEQSWFVYIGQSQKTGRFYTGISVNPRERITAHNKGNGSKFAIDQGPLRLVYISGAFSNKSDARKREIQIKGWRSEKKMWLIGAILNKIVWRPMVLRQDFAPQGG